LQLDDLAPLLEALPDPALLVNREGRITGSNAAARRQLEFEASGLMLAAILRQHEVLDSAKLAAHDGVTRTVEYESTSPVEEHFKVYAAPVAWGADAAALLVFHNETTLIATERMRADFLANASHELRTPLASLGLLIETISGAARDDPQAQAKFFPLMQVQLDRMRRLIDDLLSLSKIELNEHVPPTDVADLGDVAREVLDTLRQVADEAGVRLELVVEAAAPKVVGDHFQLVQVAQNLIHNAIKYSPQDGVVRIFVGPAQGREEAIAMSGKRWAEAVGVSLLTAAPLPEGRFAYLRVEDQGPGIARRHLPRLSERFYRAEREESSERRGTGLGLAIVKHIMNRHRGGFVVETVVERGSAFGIYLEQARK
jgi:two-component system phosphate regulon sensor histidine kinase PhoR